MKFLLHILKYKALAYLRFDSKLTLTLLIKNISSGLIYSGFAVGSYYFSYKLIHFLLNEIKIGLFLLHEFISMTFFIFFVSVNVGNIIVSYATLYKSNEVQFYFSKPIDPTKIFILKFLDNFFYSSSTMLLILFSILTAYAVYFHFSIFAILIALLFNIIPFILTAGSLGVIALLVIIKLASKFGIRKVIYLVTSFYIAAIFLFFKITSPAKLVESVIKYYPILDKDQFLKQLVPPIINYLPNSWLAESLYWSAQGVYVNSINLVLLQISVAACVFALAIILGRKWYFDTWLKNLKIMSDNRNKIFNNKNILSISIKTFLKPQTDSIFKKDLLVFIREPSQVIHISVLLFLTLIFVASVSGIRFAGLGNFMLQTIIYLSIILFDLLLLSTFSLRFVFPTISLEGQTFWKIKSAPVDIKKYLLIKIVPAGLLILLVGQSLSFFTNYRFGYQLIIFSGLITAFASIAIIMINFGMGGLFANYKEKNPIRISSSQGASISFLINVLFMFLMITLIMNPVSNLFLQITMKREMDFTPFIIPTVGIVLISSLVALVFYNLGMNYLKKDF